MQTVPSTVLLTWVGSRLMVGTDSRGHSLTIGYQREQEPQGNGAKPSDLLLLAAASCSAYDVVTILEKQRQPLAGLDIICTGEQLSESPYSFVSIHLHYIARGPVDEGKLARAIQLSEEKYCSVVTSLTAGIKITSDYEITRD
jgi:putative redox protein